MRKPQVLIVEDEVIISMNIKNILYKNGYDVTDITRTGEEAIRLADSQEPDVILMDIILHDKMDGITAAETIKSKHDIPIIYITAHSDEVTLNRAIETEPYGYVLKPIDEKNLFTAIELALYKHNMEMKLKESKEKINQKNIELQATIEELERTNEKFEAQNVELRAAQKEYEASEKKYHTLFTKMIDGYAFHEIICDKMGKPVDYRFLDINPAFEELTGLTREIIGRTAREVMPGIEDYWIETYGKVALTGESTRFQNFSAHINKWFEITVFRPKENQFTSVLIDITEKKIAESRASSLAEILETSLNEVYIFDAETFKFVYVDRGARENLGYSMKELQNLTPLDLNTEFNKNFFIDLITPLRFGEKNTIQYQTVNRRKDGSLYPVEAHIQLSVYELKSVFVAFILDITDQKKVQNKDN